MAENKAVEIQTLRIGSKFCVAFNEDLVGKLLDLSPSCARVRITERKTTEFTTADGTQVKFSKKTKDTSWALSTMVLKYQRKKK